MLISPKINRMNEKLTKKELAHKWTKLGGDVPQVYLTYESLVKTYQSELDF